MSGFIFGQVNKRTNKIFSSIKVANEINIFKGDSKAVVDSLHYDGDNASAIGTNAADTFGFFAYYPAANLAAHNSLGNTITSIKLFINGATNVTSSEIRLYSSQTTLVYSQPFTAVEGWNNVVLTTPFAIPTTDLYFGYFLTVSGGYPAGVDGATTAIPNGNFMLYGGSWYHLTDLAASLTGTWNIRAMVDGTALSVPVASCTPLTWDAGHVATGNSVTSGSFTLTNTGASTLTASAITGLSAPFTTSFVPSSVSLTAGQSTTFTFTYAPTAAGTNNQTAVIATNGGNISIALTGKGIVCSSAISSYPYTEDFETYFVPDCWTSNDADGDGYDWSALASYGHNGSICATSASYINGVGALTPDNYLITRQFNINNANLALKFWVAPLDPGYPAEVYSVMVSTTGTAVADFTTVFSDTLAEADSAFVEKMVSLAAYNGQNIYIAFRHFNCTDNYFLLLDDVSISVEAGISELDINSSVNVYPNPVQNVLSIESAKQILSVNILNPVGQLVLSETPNVNSYKLNTANLKAGVYFVQVQTAKGIVTKKINVTK